VRSTQPPRIPTRLLTWLATVVVLGLFATMLVVIAHDGILYPGDRMATLGRIGTIDGLILLALLALRAAWRFFTTSLRALYWPTVIATVVLGLNGTTTILNGTADFYLLRVGAYVDAICLLAAFSLWRTRNAVKKV
jgi:cytochrome b561